MIVQCDACQTKFRIDDSKVTEKGVKVKCTKCQNTFMVKPEAAAAPVPPSPASPPEESQFDISFGTEAETEAQPQPPKEKEMTEDEKLAAEWAKSMSFEEEKPAEKKEMTEDERLAAEWAKSISFEEEKPAEKEEPKESDIAGIEASEAAMQMPSLGELSSFSFEEEEKKQPAADIFAEPAAEEKPIFETELPPPTVKEEPVFEFPSEKAVEPQTFEQVFEQAAEVPAELHPLSSLEHEETHEEIHEEPHEKTDEISSSVPQEIIHTRSKLIPILAVLVIIVGFALFYLSGGVSSVFKMSNKKPSASTGRFDIVELKGYYTENTSIGKLFVIEGKITSTFDKSKDIMGIKGSLFNSKGETMEENMTSPGTIIAIDDLKTISKEELENRFKNKKKTSFPAKGSMPFMIVFSGLSTDPQEYGVELIQTQ